MGLVSRVVDRVVHTAPQPRSAPAPDVLRLHAATPVVDLVVGSALFRDTFLSRLGHGQVDLPRLLAGGVNVVGLTVATRHPDLRGSLSGIHFRSLGMATAVRRSGSDMAIAEWLIARVQRWAEQSAGQLRIVRRPADLDACLQSGGPVGVFMGIQGGHVLDGDPRNIARLHALGVRMLAPAHVMDNALVGSGTGRQRHGLTAYGREVVAALEDAGVVVDLAHMSLTGIADSLKVVRRPFVLSHTGLVERSGRSSRWRRYTPRSRNIPAAVASDVAAAGGVVGIILASSLLGGDDVDHAAATIRLALQVAGPDGVAIGSDMDGGLRTVIDAAGWPTLTGALLESGVTPAEVSAVLGGNALRVLGRVIAPMP